MVNFTKICAVGAAILLGSACIVKDPPKPAAVPTPECVCPEVAPQQTPEPAPAPAESDGADPAPLNKDPASV